MIVPTRWARRRAVADDAGTTLSCVSRQRSSGTLPAGILCLFAIVAYFVFTGSSFILFTVNSCLLATFGAVALNVLMGTAGLVSIGNSALLAVGAFAAVFALRSGLPFPLDVVGSCLAATVIGTVIGLPALRLRGLQLALATLAGFFIVVYFANEYQTDTDSPGGFFLNPLYQSKGLVGGQRYWAWTLVVLVSILIIAAAWLSSGRTGRAWRMIRDYEAIAPAIGIRVTWYKLFAFGLSSGLIGIQGGLMAHLSGAVTAEEFTLQMAIGYVAMVVVGGLDSLLGSVIGATVVTALPVIISKIWSGSSSITPAYAEIVYGVLIVLAVTSSTEGLAGFLRRGWRYLARRCRGREALGVVS